MLLLALLPCWRATFSPISYFSRRASEPLAPLPLRAGLGPVPSPGPPSPARDALTASTKKSASLTPCSHQIGRVLQLKSAG